LPLSIPTFSVQMLPNYQNLSMTYCITQHYWLIISAFFLHLFNFLDVYLTAHFPRQASSTNSVYLWLFLWLTQLKLECRFDTYYGTETVPRQVPFQHLKVFVFVSVWKRHSVYTIERWKWHFECLFDTFECVLI
jgi:hypothetical protein